MWICDTHSDTLFAMGVEKNASPAITPARLRQGGVTLQTHRAGEVGHPTALGKGAVFGLCVDAQNALFSDLERLFNGFDRARLRQA